LMADIERRMAQWLPAYAELRRLTQSGDPDGAVRILTERITAHYLATGEEAKELAQICEALMQQDYRSSAANLSATRWLMLLLIGGAAIAGIFAILLVRSTSVDLRSVAAMMLE